MILPVPIYGQRDNRWALQRLGTTNGITIGSHGCVVTSMSMLASYYGHQIFPNQLDDFLTNNSLYYDGDLFVNGSISKLFPDIKFDKVVFCETTPAPVDQIKAYLDQGKPVVVSLLNFGVRHFILAVGYDGDRIYANDPWQGDQVAINDRWGNPVTKILQINFFSGPVITQVLPVPPQTPQPIVVNPVNIDPGGDHQPIETPVTVTPPVEQPVVDQPNIAPTNPTININTPAMENTIAAELKNLKDSLDNLQANTRELPTKTVNQIFIDSLKSRKFILALGSAVVAFVNSKFNLGITDTQLWLIVIPILAFILVEGFADIVGRQKN